MTSSNGHQSGKAGCLPDATLELHALGLLELARAEAVEAHLRSCPDCATRYESISTQSLAVKSAVCAGLAAETPKEPCPDRERLALYLDCALSEERREELENHLAGCRRCRTVLKDIYRETQVLCGASSIDELVNAEVRPAEPVSIETQRRKETRRRMMSFRLCRADVVVLACMVVVVAVAGYFSLWTGGALLVLSVGFISGLFIGRAQGKADTRGNGAAAHTKQETRENKKAVGHDE